MRLPQGHRALMREQEDILVDLIVRRLTAPLGHMAKSPGLDVKDVDKKLYKFQGAWREFVREQGEWVLTDAGVRRRVRVRVAEEVSGVYQAFIGPHMGSLRALTAYQWDYESLKKQAMRSLFAATVSKSARGPSREPSN